MNNSFFLGYATGTQAQFSTIKREKENIENQNNRIEKEKKRIVEIKDIANERKITLNIFKNEYSKDIYNKMYQIVKAYVYDSTNKRLFFFRNRDDLNDKFNDIKYVPKKYVYYNKGISEEEEDEDWVIVQNFKIIKKKKYIF